MNLHKMSAHSLDYMRCTNGFVSLALYFIVYNIIVCNGLDTVSRLLLWWPMLDQTRKMCTSICSPHLDAVSFSLVDASASPFRFCYMVFCLHRASRLSFLNLETWTLDAHIYTYSTLHIIPIIIIFVQSSDYINAIQWDIMCAQANAFPTHVL